MHVFTILLGCLLVVGRVFASPCGFYGPSLAPPLAFAAGGFGGSSSTSKANSKTKRGKRNGGMAEVVPVQPKQSTSKQSEPQLDRFGLPPPTSDDIFPRMPPETELIAATKENFSLQEVKDALKEQFSLRLDHFDDNGVEIINSPTDRDRAPMKLRLIHQSPPVLAIDNYLTPEQCLEVQEVVVPPPSSAKQQQQQQEAVQVNSATFSPLATSKRTSTSWFCHYAQVPTMLAKMNHMLGIPLELMEEPQIVRYKKGQEFSWHYDEVPKAQLANGGQRLATLLVYLNTVQSGGGTIFRDLKDRDGNPLTMKPVQGSALLFFPADANGKPDDRTLHKGEVVTLDDEKWIIQLWIHEREYGAAVPRGNSQQAAIEAVNQASLDLGYR
jgi:prolyl 4-hydroxylase